MLSFGAFFVIRRVFLNVVNKMLENKVLGSKIKIADFDGRNFMSSIWISWKLIM